MLLAITSKICFTISREWVTSKIALDVLFGGWGVGGILLCDDARDEKQGQD